MAGLTTQAKNPVGIVTLILGFLTLTATVSGIGTEAVVLNEPFPVGETLGYAVSWMGIRCGHMDITSFTETDAEGREIYRIALHAQTTKFFDGIYRVRSRLDSFVDPERMASFRYEEHALEKKKRPLHQRVAEAILTERISSLTPAASASARLWR